jgi:lipoate-protein ligase A
MKAVAGQYNHYKDKSVRSFPAKVANVSFLLDEKLSIEEFIGLFRSYIFKYYPASYIDELSRKERESITKLSEEKYKKIEWNFGYSPDYIYDTQWEMNKEKFSISFFVSKGQIRKAEINGPQKYSLFLKAASNQLTGAYHEKKSLWERLKTFTFAGNIEKNLIENIFLHLL